MNVNPYATPNVDEDLSQPITWTLAFLAAIRFAVTGWIALILLIAFSGSWINWPNVIPVLAILGIGLITSHFIEQRLMETRPKSLWIAAISYSLGCTTAFAFFVLDRSYDWLGHFTGV